VDLSEILQEWRAAIGAQVEVARDERPVRQPRPSRPRRPR
jgi:hypothetical protein